ncbi:hypothetical protein Trydic_g9588 [Trypoxylus dichotomus]
MKLCRGGRDSDLCKRIRTEYQSGNGVRSGKHFCSETSSRHAHKVRAPLDNEETYECLLCIFRILSAKFLKARPEKERRLASVPAWHSHTVKIHVLASSPLRRLKFETTVPQKASQSTTSFLTGVNSVRVNKTKQKQHKRNSSPNECPSVFAEGKFGDFGEKLFFLLSSVLPANLPSRFYGRIG